MGVDDRMSSLQAQETESKAHQLLVFKGSQPYVAGSLSRYRESTRRNIEVGQLPHFPFDGFDLHQIIKCRQIMNGNDRLGARLRHDTRRTIYARNAGHARAD